MYKYSDMSCNNNPYTKYIKMGICHERCLKVPSDIWFWEVTCNGPSPSNADMNMILGKDSWERVRRWIDGILNCLHSLCRWRTQNLPSTLPIAPLELALSIRGSCCYVPLHPNKRPCIIYTVKHLLLACIYIYIYIERERERVIMV